MTAQHPLFTEPHFTDRWCAGDRVVSTYTGNTGVVTAVVPGRHLLIEWAAWRSYFADREPYVVRHSSESGLRREAP